MDEIGRFMLGWGELCKISYNAKMGWETKILKRSHVG